MGDDITLERVAVWRAESGRISAACRTRRTTAAYPNYREADFFLKYSVMNHVKP